MLRYSAYVLFGAKPLTTVAVNLSGAFLIGVLASWSDDYRAKLFLGTGILGGFTTFSAWQLEALIAARVHGAGRDAAGILFGSLAAGFAICWVGYSLGQRLR